MTKNGFVILALCSALSVSCTKAGKGAAIGGVAGGAVGAGVGAAAGGKKGAAIGAGVGVATGATAGAVIGHYLDKKEKRLREKVRSASIERHGDELIVRFESGILFDVNRYDLKSASIEGLQDFADVLKEFPKTDLRIEGHTDSSGSNNYNKKLSRQRAESVVSFLEAKGVTNRRMRSVGLGENKPVANNETAAGRQLNRRVEVKITANEELQREAETG